MSENGIKGIVALHTAHSTSIDWVSLVFICSYVQEHMLYVLGSINNSTEQNKASVITEFVWLVSFIVAK